MLMRIIILIRRTITCGFYTSVCTRETHERTRWRERESELQQEKMLSLSHRQRIRQIGKINSKISYIKMLNGGFAVLIKSVFTCC